MFDCSMAKYVWSLTAHVLGVTCRPTNFDQFWEWAEQYIQNSKKNSHGGAGSYLLGSVEIHE